VSNFEFELDGFENQAAATKTPTNGNASWIVKLSPHIKEHSPRKQYAPMKSKAVDDIRILGTPRTFWNHQLMKDWRKKIAFIENKSKQAISKPIRGSVFRCSFLK